MHVVVRVSGGLAATWLLVGCATAAPAPAAPSSVPPATVPTLPMTPPPTATPARTVAPTKASMPVASASGPVVIASKLYPYTLTVSAGPVSFIGAPAPWDGAQVLSTDSRMTDRARVPGAGLLFIAMTETTKGIDAYADEMEAKFRAGHGCLPTSGRQAFAVGDLQGVAFSQSCGNGSHLWNRALLVGDGRAMVAMSDGGTIENLIEALGGIEFVDR